MSRIWLRFGTLGRLQRSDRKAEPRNAAHRRHQKRVSNFERKRSIASFEGESFSNWVQW